MSRFNPFHSSNKNWVAQAEHKLKVAWLTQDMTSVVQALNQLMGSIPAPMWEEVPDTAFSIFISWAFQASQVCDQVREMMDNKGNSALEVNLDAQPCLIVPQCLHRNYGTATTECAQSLLQLAAEAQLQIKESSIGQPRLSLVLVIDAASPQIAYWRLIKHGLEFQSGWVEPFHEPAAAGSSEYTTQDALVQPTTDLKAAAAHVAIAPSDPHLKTTFQYVIELAAEAPNGINQLTITPDKLVSNLLLLVQKLKQAGIKFTPTELTPMVNAAIRASLATDAPNAIVVDRAALTEQLSATLLDLKPGSAS